jgi:FixJ family two-component response regulator
MTDYTAAFLVAIVEDDRSILDSLGTLLESADYDVRAFDSASGLLESDCLRDIDCLITDISMAGIDGYELARTVYERQPELPVVFVTGRPDLLRMVQNVGSRRYRAFLKPFDGETLLAAVADVLRSVPRRRGSY